MKGHAYLKKPVAESCRFVKISLTSQWSQGTKGLSKEWNEIKEILPPKYCHQIFHRNDIIYPLFLLALVNGIKYSRMDQVKFVKCLPQISLGSFFNTLSQTWPYLGHNQHENKTWANFWGRQMIPRRVDLRNWRS